MNKMKIERAKMKSLDMTQENIRKIQILFPNAVTEVMDDASNTKLAVDFDILKQELSDSLADEKQERYQMTWPDKKQSIIMANKSISAALRPVVGKSVNFNETKNIYVEGDNLDVLKLLRETYLGRIKMIYIDPPYNTGNDFVYDDDFYQSDAEYSRMSGQFDNQGNRLFQNTESSGRFHTDWLNMIYPRLKVAKDLLSDEGSIFISIDDNEQTNLKKICDEIFGEHNFVSTLVWQKNFAPKNDNKYISNSTEYVLLYAKDKTKFQRGLLPREEKHNKGYANPDNDSRGLWTSGSMLATTFSKSGVFEIVSPSGIKHLPPAGRCWRYSQSTVEKLISENRIWWGSDGNGVPRVKRFLSEMPDGIVPQNLMLYTEVGSNQDGNLEMKELFNAQIFDYPKCTKLMERLITIGNLSKNDIVLDFFSGSGTLAHAVMKHNAENNANLRYILVQLPEKYDDNSGKYSFDTICDIGEERIRRAGIIIKENAGILGTDLDVGFRVFKLDSSNMNEVYYNPKAMTQNLLEATVDNIKPDRTPLDLLFQVMLECGALLSSKIEEKVINGKKVYVVEDNYIAACFDDEVDDKTVEEIAKLHPIYVCFKGSSFNSDSANINAEQIFKTYSPNTEKIKVI